MGIKKSYCTASHTIALIIKHSSIIAPVTKETKSYRKRMNIVSLYIASNRADLVCDNVKRIDNQTGDHHNYTIIDECKSSSTKQSAFPGICGTGKLTQLFVVNILIVLQESMMVGIWIRYLPVKGTRQNAKRKRPSISKPVLSPSRQSSNTYKLILVDPVLPT